MFAVLAFVYQHYLPGDACPQPSQLERKLHAVGFDTQEVEDALDWLNGLRQATGDTVRPLAQQTCVLPCDQEQAPHLQQPASGSLRVFSVAEQNRLGAACLGFICFLEQAARLPVYMREIVVDRAMACGCDTLDLEDLKTIVLMVYWSFGEEPNALVLDELCTDARDRIAH